jgi:hypothetical protein
VNRIQFYRGEDWDTAAAWTFKTVINGSKRNRNSHGHMNILGKWFLCRESYLTLSFYKWEIWEKEEGVSIRPLAFHRDWASMSWASAFTTVSITPLRWQRGKGFMKRREKRIIKVHYTSVWNVMMIPLTMHNLTCQLKIFMQEWPLNKRQTRKSLSSLNPN